MNQSTPFGMPGYGDGRPLRPGQPGPPAGAGGWPPAPAGGPQGPPPGQGFPARAHPGHPGRPGPYPYPHAHRPGGPAPRRSGGRAAAVAVAAVLVLLSAGFGGWWFLLRDGGGGVESLTTYQEWAAAAEELGTAGVAVQVVQPDAPGGAHEVTTQGHWFTDTHFVRRTLGGVTAYDLSTGEADWEYQLPGSRLSSCPASLEQSGGRVVLLSGEPAENGGSSVCRTVTLLDIGTGEQVWSVDVPGLAHHEDVYPGSQDTPVIFGDRVLVSSAAGGHILSLETGEPVVEAEPVRECFAYRYAVFGDTLLQRLTCGQSGGGGLGKGGALVAWGQNGEELWSWRLPADDARVDGVISLEPLVAEVTSGNRSQVWHIDPATGEHSVVLADYDETRGFPCVPGGLRNCPRALVADGRLVMQVELPHINPGDSGHEGGHGHPNYQNQLVALDLADGSEVWRTERVQNRKLGLVTVDGDRIIAYQEPKRIGTKGDGVPAMVVAVDPSSGAVTPVMAMGPETYRPPLRALSEQSYFGKVTNVRPAWDNGRFAMMQTSLMRQNDGVLETLVFTRP